MLQTDARGAPNEISSTHPELIVAHMMYVLFGVGAQWIWTVKNDTWRGVLGKINS